MSSTHKNINGDWYLNNQLDFDKKLIHYRYRTIKKYLKGSHGLELGSAEGEMTKYLIDDFEQLTSVDGSKELLDKISDYNNHVKVHSLFEEYNPERLFDTIIMEHILEHVDNPVSILKMAKKWLEDDGMIIVGVPNANSIHRLAAVKMGLLSSQYELNERDIQLGHQRVYSVEHIVSDIAEAGLKVLEKTGVYFKPLSNGQIEQNWTDEMQEGFYQLGKDFPDNAAEISIVCSK